MGGRAIRVSLRRQDKSTANWIFFGIAHRVPELIFRQNLAFVKASHPYIELAFQAKGEASLDVLHGLFKGNIGGWREHGVEMIGHDDVGMEQEPSLAVIVEDGSLQ
jgi:hypothetical protein